MDKHEAERPPFNERAALEQLERFKSDIERYRRQRKAVGEEFDHFVQSFKAPQTRESRPPATPPVAPPAPSRPAEAPRVDTPRAAPGPIVPVPAAPPQAPAAARHVPMAPVEPRPAVSTPTERMSAERAHGKTGGPSPVVIAALLLLVAGIAAWFFWPQVTDQAPAPAPTTAAVPQTPAPAPAQPASPPPPAPAAPSNETVVTTLAPVWLRVMADGVKVREDEVPAGTRIPVDVQKTLVIRAGNAAAVTLVLKGKDLGALGTEGQVVTRTFTVPER